MEELSIPSPCGGADTVVQVHHAAAEQFAARLRKVAKERRKWAQREGISSYRLYDADLPDYACAIDYYEAVAPVEGSSDDGGFDMAPGQAAVSVAEYQAPKHIDPVLAQERFEDVLTIIPAVLGIPAEHVFSKVRKRDKGGSQYAENAEAFCFVTKDYDVRVLVDMSSYLDTGLFLDHRTTRAFVGGLCEGKRFLNLFAYTGCATLHAAKHGAATTTTVDLSGPYLEWAEQNMELNGFTGPQHAFERADTINWLYEAARQKRLFDVIFIDPPTFSNSKAMGSRTWDVQRDHVTLLKLAKRVLAKGGVIIFSNNLRTFKIDEAGLKKEGLRVKDITAETIPLDFARNPKIHCCFMVTAE